MWKCVFIFVMSVQTIICDNNSDNQLAAEHYARIVKGAKCDKPVPRVLYLSKLFPKINKKYIPFATVLSVCDSSAGCCTDESHRCVPKTIKPITLHFLALELTPEGNKKSVEAINFENHTHCQCRHINSEEKLEILEEYSTQQNLSFISTSNHWELQENVMHSNASKLICSCNSTTILMALILILFYSSFTCRLRKHLSLNR